MIAIAKWVGIILCIICGIGLMAGAPGTIAKVLGLFLGLIFALFALRSLLGYRVYRRCAVAVSRPGARTLNKPLLIVGVDRKRAGLDFLIAVIVGANDGFLPTISAFVLFIIIWTIGRRLTRIDPNIFLVMNTS